MSTPRLPDRPSIAMLLVHSAATLVPKRHRWEWRQEWQSELWYVHRESANTSDVQASWTCIRFASGAFSDAVWFRQNLESRSSRVHSPLECATWLAGLTVFTFVIAFMLPGSREALTSLNRSDSRHLVSISRAGLISATTPTIDVAEYQRWQRRGRAWFSDMTFYRTERASVTAGGQKPHTANVVIASDSFARIFDLPIPPELISAAHSRRLSVAVLSARAARQFGPDDQTGRVLTVSGQQALVSAERHNHDPLAPDFDVLLLVPDSQWATNSDKPGYVLAEMTRSAQTLGQGSNWNFTSQEDGETVGFVCRPVSDRTPRPAHTFFFALFLACLALPATTPIPLGEYPAAQRRQFREVRWRRWGFLAMKLSCLTAMCGALSVVIGFNGPEAWANNAGAIELLIAFLALLFSFRWALRDQRLRCPVCLTILTNPAQVGHPSRCFLAWHGTELMCGEGHGLLHIPDMSTSWFSTQRWLALDGSWRGLFPDLVRR